MRTLDHAATLAALPFEALTREVEHILGAAQRGEAHCPTRLAVPLPDDAVLLAMPASDTGIAVVKTVTVHPGNAARGLAVVGAEVLVMDARTGKRLGLIDGEAVTAQRTAVVSVVAVRRLRPAHGRRLLVVGAGVQAAVHIQAFRECLGAIEVRIASRSRARAQALAERVGASITSLDAAAVAWADLIVTATTSVDPVLPDAVRDDAMVCGVGSFKAAMAELPESLIRRSHLAVDRLAPCRAEAGDLLRAGVDFARVVDLADAAPVDTSRPAVFKSVGNALWDLAAARCVARQMGW